jgi:hypothetical protein
MKNLRTSLLFVCIAFSGMYSFAQTTQALRNSDPNSNKPKLFQSLPENISVSVDNLNNLVNTPVGNSVSVNLSDNSQFQFEGQVVSSSTKEDNNIQTVVIRSTNYNGARLTLSKITNADGTITYSGRILSFQHGDLLELKNQNGHFTLAKRKFNDLVNE